VRVPVLSDAIYSMMPRSSNILEQLILVLKSSFDMAGSNVINLACSNLTVSTVTINDMGTKLLNNINDTLD
jgi:hypothetical protein